MFLPAEEAEEVTSADQAFKKLIDGNNRYVSGKTIHPNQTSNRRTDLVSGQKPFAIILSCSDSRVPPEIIFDQGLGDLFVVRVAGNFAENGGIGSIEYAAEHLGSKLLVVLGHEKCGAVKAAVDAVTKNAKFPGQMNRFVKAIRPAVEKVKGKKGDLLDNAVRSNVKIVVGQLKSSKPILQELVKESKLKVVGARYDLDTGAVDFIVP